MECWPHSLGVQPKSLSELESGKFYGSWWSEASWSTSSLRKRVELAANDHINVSNSAIYFKKLIIDQQVYTASQGQKLGKFCESMFLYMNEDIFNILKIFLYEGCAATVAQKWSSVSFAAPALCPLKEMKRMKEIFPIPPSYISTQVSKITIVGRHFCSVVPNTVEFS